MQTRRVATGRWARREGGKFTTAAGTSRASLHRHGPGFRSAAAASPGLSPNTRSARPQPEDHDRTHCPSEVRCRRCNGAISRVNPKTKKQDLTFTVQSRWWDLNPRPQPYQGCALPLSYSGTQKSPLWAAAPGGVGMIAACLGEVVIVRALSGRAGRVFHLTPSRIFSSSCLTIRLNSGSLERRSSMVRTACMTVVWSRPPK